MGATVQQKFLSPKSERTCVPTFFFFPLFGMASHIGVGGGGIKGQECILLPTVPSVVGFWGDIFIVIALEKCLLCVRG